jgi:excisionase family DNA binding protein
MDTEYFTPAEVARQLRVDYTTVMRWIRSGILESETIQQGRRNRHRIPKASIDQIEQLGKHRSLV